MTSKEIKKMKPITKDKTCEHCHKKSGQYRINPYEQDIHNKEIYQHICDDCYKMLKEEI